MSYVVWKDIDLKY